MRGIQIQTQDIHDSVTHRKIDGSKPFWTLDFGEPLNHTSLFFHETGQVDAVIAELTVIRAEMTGACGDIAPHTGLPCTEADEHERHRNGMVVWGPGVTEDVIRVELKAHVFTLRDPGGVLCNCGQLREHSVHVAPETAAVAS